MTKDDKLLIEINHELKKEFKRLCKQNDSSMGRELRRIIQQAVKKGELPK